MWILSDFYWPTSPVLWDQCNDFLSVLHDRSCTAFHVNTFFKGAQYSTNKAMPQFAWPTLKLGVFKLFFILPHPGWYIWYISFVFTLGYFPLLGSWIGFYEVQGKVFCVHEDVQTFQERRAWPCQVLKGPHFSESAAECDSPAPFLHSHTEQFGTTDRSAPNKFISRK